MKRCKRSLEHGNVIDQLGSIIVMAFVFAMILAYAAYGNVVQKRLSIDNTAKEYLYKMEQEGLLTDADKANMTKDLADAGVTVEDFNGTTTKQVAYGDKVELICKVKFENPLYTVFKKDSLISISGFEETIEHTIKMSATSKW